MTRRTLLALALVLALPATASAQESGVPGICEADAKKLCADAPAGHGAKMRCLSQHDAELSTDCKERIAAVRKQVEELDKRCGEDARKFCAAPDQRSHLIVCLAQHEQELSAPCKSWLGEHKK